MHLIGRYERLRAWTPAEERLSAPLLLDRKWSSLKPTGGDEWWRSRRGIWHQVQDILTDQRGVVGLVGDVSAIPNYPFNDPEDTSLAALGLDLATNYIAGTSGAALASRIVMANARTLNSLYVYMLGFSGTRANVNDLNLEVRSDSSGAPDTSGPGLLASGSLDPSASETGWNRLTGLSIALSAGTRYWLICGDADGGGTDYATPAVIQGNSAGYYASVRARRGCGAYTTANGWTTQAERTGRGMVCGIFSDGTGIGFPFTSGGTVPSSTTQRGLLLQGLTEAIEIYGAVASLAIAGTPALNIWANEDGPGGSPAATGAVSVYGLLAAASGVLLSAPFTLAKSTQYRVVLKGSSSSTIVRTIKIGTINTGSAAELMQAAPGRGGLYYTEERTSPNDWNNDDTTALPLMSLLIQDQVAGSGGGVSRARIVGGV